MKIGKGAQITLIDQVSKNGRWLKLRKYLEKARKAIEAIEAKKAKRIPRGEIVVVFCGDKQTRRVKKIFWGKALTTDVISLAYPQHTQDEPAVEIIINVEQANRQKERWGLKHELVFLFIHGLLHVLGYDDRTPAMRKQMLALGEKILNESYPIH